MLHNKGMAMEITADDIKWASRMLFGEDDGFDDEKDNILLCNESADIVACPGSGKTTTLLAKLSILAKKMPFDDGKGICVLTHTNVAIDEIKARLGAQVDALFSYPNFFGTIQSFVDTFLAIPYFNAINPDRHIQVIDSERADGYKKRALYQKNFKELGYFYQKCKEEVDKLKGNSVERLLQSKKIYSDRLLNKFRYIPNKNEYHYDAGKRHENIKQGSKSFSLVDSVCGAGLKEGVLSYDEAYDYAKVYVESLGGRLSDIMAERFKYVFVDETQDCSTVQFDILDKLFDPKKIIVQRFGDPNQAIYSGFNDDAAEWKLQDKVLPITSSQRFGEDIAKPLRTVCPKHCPELKGSKSLHSIKPTIIVFEDPKKVLPAFIEVIKDKLVNDKSLADVAKEKREHDVFNRHFIKAVGSRKTHDKGLSISSYFPAFSATANNKVHEQYDCLQSYFVVNPKANSPHEHVNQFLHALVKVLSELSITHSETGKKFTISTLKSHLKSQQKWDDLKIHVQQWSRLMLQCQSSFCQQAYDSFKAFLISDFTQWLNIEADLSTVDFVKASLPVDANPPQPDVAPVTNTYTQDGYEIEVNTIHAVKGETHCATLYLECYYNRKTDISRIGQQLRGISNTSDDRYTLSSLRLAHVALSRPKYLACMAMTKAEFDILDSEELREIWDVQLA